MLSSFRQNSSANLNLSDSKPKGAWRNGSARSSYCRKAVRLRLRVRYVTSDPLSIPFADVCLQSPLVLGATLLLFLMLFCS